MAVRCAKCGEELLGAVNRCWKCGTMFAARPELDGRPPVRVEMPPAEAMLNAEPLDAAISFGDPVWPGTLGLESLGPESLRLLPEQRTSMRDVGADRHV